MRPAQEIDWEVELSAANQAGLTVKALSEKLSVATSTIYKFENRTGIRLKRARSVRPHKGNSSGIDWPEELQRARTLKLSTTALARELSVSVTTVLHAEDRTRIFLVRRRPDRRRVGGAL